MNCVEFETSLHPFVDGELEVDELVGAEAHLAECARCRGLAEREREFRVLLRRQPREAAPPELRARIRAELRRTARLRALRPWLVAPAASLATAALVLVALVPVFRQPEPVTAQLVDKHIAYSQLEQPAEFASTDPEAVARWLTERARLQVTVPDYSPAGIRLVGARVSEAATQRAAYLLYAKGHTLMSVFMVAKGGRRMSVDGDPIVFQGLEYRARDHKGYRTVAWTDGDAVYGLVSMLDYASLLECASKLRVGRAETRL